MNDTFLIHITKQFDDLVKILKSRSFKLSYCGEDFNVGNEKVSSAAHPMVCFSEYTYAELTDRDITYGKYGIALTKNWAKEKKLNPVVYVEDTSQVAKGLGKLLKARQGKIEGLELPSQLRLPIMQLKCFTKNVRGYNSYLEDKDFYFKKENEWRYVPTIEEIEGNYISQNFSKYNKCKEIYNDKVGNYSLEFSVEEVVEVYVSNENEIKILNEMDIFGLNNSQIYPWEYIEK